LLKSWKKWELLKPVLLAEQGRFTSPKRDKSFVPILIELLDFYLNELLD